MYSFADPFFWLNGIYFFIAVFLAFFIPGHCIIRKIKFDAFSEVIFSIIVGFVSWSLIGFITGFLHLRFLLYPYLFVSFFLWIKGKNYHIFSKLFSKKPDITIVFILCTGTLIQLFSIFFSGVLIDNGLYFCCGIPDTITHLALTNELIKQFPPYEPGFSSIPLLNYHYLSNLGVADLIRIFHLPLISTQYQYITIYCSLLLGLTGIAFGKQLGLPKKTIRWLLFFLYFAGDIIFLLSFLNHQGLQFSFTTLENASSLWVSPPRFFAIIVFLGGTALFVNWIKTNKWYHGIIAAVVLGSLIGIKIYIGILAATGLCAVMLYLFYTRQYKRCFPLLPFFANGVLLWIPVNTNAGGLVFTGFWRFEDFIVQPVLGLSHLELARRVFVTHQNFIRAYAYDVFFAFLYVVFSSGTLLLGIFQTKQSSRSIPKELHIFLLSGLISTCIAGFFFLQKTGGANTSQFLISIYLVGTFYASLAVVYWIKNLPKTWSIILMILVIIWTIPRVLHSTSTHIQYTKNLYGAFIPNGTLPAYTFFQKTPKDSVILFYDDTTLDCLFTTFLGDRRPYLCTVGLPGVIDDTIIAERNAIKQKIFFGENLETVQNLLQTNAISYIFIPKKYIDQTTIPLFTFPIVFETDTIAIYKAR